MSLSVSKTEKLIIDYINTLEQHDRIKRAIKHARIEIEKELVSEVCPVSIGETVEVNDFAYHGKTILVDSISVANRNQYLLPTKGQPLALVTFFLRGYVLKKNGKPGVNRAKRKVVVRVEKTNESAMIEAVCKMIDMGGE